MGRLLSRALELVFLVILSAGVFIACLALGVVRSILAGALELLSSIDETLEGVADIWRAS